MRHDQYATLLFCYHAHPLSYSYIHGDTCARAHSRARVHQLSRFPPPHSFPLPCTSYRQSSVVSNGNSKSEQHHRQQHQKRLTVRFEAVFLLLCWLALSSVFSTLPSSSFGRALSIHCHPTGQKSCVVSFCALFFFLISCQMISKLFFLFPSFRFI